MPRLGRRDTGQREGNRGQAQPTASGERQHSHFHDNPSARLVLWRERNAAPEPFQTFSLDIGNGARIKSLLLDRFLACMKPASIT
jgi:hypothetical protein